MNKEQILIKGSIIDLLGKLKSQEMRRAVLRDLHGVYFTTDLSLEEVKSSRTLDIIAHYSCYAARKIHRGYFPVRETYEPFNAEFGIKELKSKSRYKPYVEARKIYCFLSHKLTGYSLSQIGLYFNSDHATVLHHKKTVKNFIETEKDYGGVVSDFENMIKSHMISYESQISYQNDL